MVVENKNSSEPFGPDFSGWKGLGLELLAFLFTAFMIFREGWSPTDLVWALWVSSLFIGWAIIFVWLLGSLKKGNASSFGIAIFFTFHFSFFHLVHAVFLNVFFSPDGQNMLSTGAVTNPFAQVPNTIINAFTGSFFFVLATFMVRFAEVRSAFNTEGLDKALSYVSVIKMHIMIIFLGFVMVGLSALGGFGTPLLMVIVLVFHFFPFEALRHRLKIFKNSN